MNATLHAAKLGLLRSWIEFKLFLRNPQEMIWLIIMPAIFLTVMWFQKDATVDGASLALLTLPSLLGMLIANGGFVGIAGTLSTDREDGTLLRFKATPHGMIGYLVSRIVYLILSTAISLVALFVPGIFMVSGLLEVGLGGVLTFVFLFFLGFFATAPWGAIIGSLVKTPSSGFGLTFLPFIGLVAISGIFYPIAALPVWLQGVAQIFPLYWLGLGVRSVFLPDVAAATEIAGTWRPELTFIILGVWAVVGLALAPRILRRMAQRESGSDMETRRQKALQRGY